MTGCRVRVLETNDANDLHQMNSFVQVMAGHLTIRLNALVCGVTSGVYCTDDNSPRMPRQFGIASGEVTPSKYLDTVHIKFNTIVLFSTSHSRLSIHRFPAADSEGNVAYGRMLGALRENHQLSTRQAERVALASSRLERKAVLLGETAADPVRSLAAEAILATS